MSKPKVTEVVWQLALPIAENFGLELVDVEYKKEGANWFLRVFIDKEAGVDIEDCSMVSEQLSDLLDEVDPIPDSYFLEVSSPGAERPLKKANDFKRALHKTIFVSTYEPVENKKEFEGVLISYTDDRLQLEANGQTLTFPLDKIASARLMVQF